MHAGRCPVDNLSGPERIFGPFADLPGRSGIIKILIFPMGLYSYMKNLNVSGSKPQGNDYCKKWKGILITSPRRD